MSHLTLMIRFLRGITVLFILFISTICILLYGQLSSIVALNTKYTITASYEQNMFMMANTIKTYSYFDLTNTTV